MMIEREADWRGGSVEQRGRRPHLGAGLTVLVLAAMVLAGCQAPAPPAATPTELGQSGLPPVQTATAVPASPTPAATATVRASATATDWSPPTLTPTGSPTPTDTPAPTDTLAPSDTPPPATATPEPPTATATQPPTSTTASALRGDPLACNVRNIAWTDYGRLLRGGRPEADALACLAEAGVTVIIDQRMPSEDSINEPELARQAGIEYINLGVPDDTAPSPEILAGWIGTVSSRLAEGKIVLVHDTAGRGRMGFWDAVYYMLAGHSAERAIEERYLAKALDFAGAKIDCNNGGKGQVQALAEIAQALTGTAYYPQVDEYGSGWENCPRPGYMDGWDYAAIVQ